MIRPLRARHRRLVAGLAVVLPLGLSAALVARPPEVTEPRAPELVLSEAALAPAGPMARVFVRAFGRWGAPLEATLGKDADGRTSIEFRPTGPLLQPDLLAYWVPAGATALSGSMPAEALLLGRLGESAQRFRLPAGQGRIELRDLARGRTLAAVAVPELVGD